MPEAEERRRARALVRALAVVVVGGALAVAAAGALAGTPALLALGVVVAFEETLELAVVGAALRLAGMPAAGVPAMRVHLAGYPRAHRSRREETR